MQLTEDFEVGVAEEKENPFELVEPAAETKLPAEIDVKDEEDDAEEKEKPFEPVEPTAQAEVEVDLKTELAEEFEDATITEEEEPAFEPVAPTAQAEA